MNTAPLYDSFQLILLLIIYYNIFDINMNIL